MRAPEVTWRSDKAQPATGFCKCSTRIGADIRNMRGRIVPGPPARDVCEWAHDMREIVKCTAAGMGCRSAQGR